MAQQKYLGIDLGTSNSAVAVSVDGDVDLINNTRGEVNNPSVVRVSKQGIVVGHKARKYLHSDTQNTFKEFKRLMGTETQTKPDRNGDRWSAEALSAEVLKFLKTMAEEQCDTLFNKVVITVPALFELPQSRATSDAARLAGFEQVELLPEPVASGLAAGWNEQESGKAWLVYDLGGGTFDVSLLEARDGLLRVVGHDGDNFLGGRDIDRVLVQWAIEHIEQHTDLSLKTDHDDYAVVRRHLEHACEQAKIRLSNTPNTQIELEFEYDDEDYELDIDLSRDQLHELCKPLIQRSIDICQRLLNNHGLDLERLGRVVLVGGPAHMPLIQTMVSEQLAPLAETQQDPMGLVAQGAALYATTIGLACTASTESKAETADESALWLQYPSVCTELNPALLGRVLNSGLNVQKVLAKRSDELWQSPEVEVDEQGVFSIDLAIAAGSKAQYQVYAVEPNGETRAIPHSTVNILHGLTMSDPPLSRSIGIALADGRVKKFIERGTPLPAKRMFSQSTVNHLEPGSDDSLAIPIVQGERYKSRFCRKVGHLTIEAQHLKAALPAGSAVQITIEVNRGGDLVAQAYVPDHGLLIDGVAQLTMASVNPDELIRQAQGLNTRLSDLLKGAFREGDEQLIALLNPLSAPLHAALVDLADLNAEDTDSCQRLSRELMDLEAALEEAESRHQMKELVQECEDRYYETASVVNDYGDDTDRRILADCGKQLEQACRLAKSSMLERLVERLEQLYRSAHSKSPTYWVDVFEYWASFATSANDPRHAEKLVVKGRKLIEKEQYGGLRGITNQIYALLPAHLKRESEDSHDSGVF